MSDFNERAAAARDAAGPLGNVTVVALREWFKRGGRRAFVRFAMDYPPPPPPLRQRGRHRDPERVARAEHELDRYINYGWTLGQIGDEVGMSRERVRQDLAEFVPVLYQWARKHRAARRKFLADEQRRSPCFVCGVEVSTKTGRSGSKRRFCSREHYDVWAHLRYQLGGQEERDRHREYVHTWAERHPDHPGVSLRHVENVRNGTAERRGHWITRGSKVEALAMEAYRKGWPIFDLLLPEVQQQIKYRLNPPPPGTPRRRRWSNADVAVRRDLVDLMWKEGRSGQEIADYLGIEVRRVYSDVYWLRHGHN